MEGGSSSPRETTFNFLLSFNTISLSVSSALLGLKLGLGYVRIRLGLQFGLELG